VVDDPGKARVCPVDVSSQLRRRHGVGAHGVYREDEPGQTGGDEEPRPRQQDPVPL
jgi:hypothetical protein